MQTIVDWLKHRFTKSRYASDDAVEQFTRVAKSERLDLDYDQGERLARLLDDPDNIEGLAKLLGQTSDKPKL